MTNRPLAAHGVATALGVYALLGGVLSLLGWIADHPRWTDWDGDGISIQPNAALAASAAATALLFFSRGFRRVATVLATLVVVIGSGTILQYVTGIELGIDTALMFDRPWGRASVTFPGRMGPPASISWTLIGLALLLGSMSQKPRARLAVVMIGLSTATLSTLALVGYLYGARILYTVPTATAIALQTATFIFAISLGLVAVVRERGPMRLLTETGPASALLRRILPAVILVPIAIGFIRISGEHALLYDAAFATTLRTLGEIVLFLLLLWWTGNTISRESKRRSETDAALHASQQRLADTLENITDGFVTFDADWRFTYMNAEAERLIGKTRSELSGRSIWDVFPELVGGAAHRELHRVAESGTSGEFEDFNPQLERWFSNNAYPAADGGVAVYFRDITAQKQAEETIRGNQQQLAADLDAMTRLQTISTQFAPTEDPEWLYEKIVDAALLIMRSEYSSMQILYFEPGRGAELRLLAYRGFNSRAAESWESIQVNSDTSWGRAWSRRERVIVPDLEAADWLGAESLATFLDTGIHATQSTPLISRNGKLLGMLSTHWREAHRPADRDLRFFDLLARMAADVIERSQHEQALRDADRRKDEFLAVLAHELRNPLAPIRNAVGLMKLDGAPSPKLVWSRDVIDRQAAHMARLLDDLMDASRIARDKLELRKQPTELAAVLRAAVETNGPFVDASKHELTVRVPTTPIYIDGDPVRLAQVFGNLLNNACKYTQPGGQLWITAERQAEQALISVRDTGIGISAGNLSSIFEMFSQLDGQRHASGGLGIGLHLVKRLVELHGGTVTAESAGVGCGTEFVVRLPVQADAPAEERRLAEANKLPVPALARRVLVVDDNEDAANTLAMLLEVSGCETKIAYDGVQALEKAASYEPDVVVLDIGLPDMTGYEVCRTLRDRQNGRKLVMIALTGWGQDEDRKKSAAAGFDGHLVKPVDHAELSKMLTSLSAKTA